MMNNLKFTKMKTARSSEQSTALLSFQRTLRPFLLSMLVFLMMFSGSKLSAQFEEESVKAAYELRMNGEIWYAEAMLSKLINQGKEAGLAHYETARVILAKMKGGINIEGAEDMVGILHSARNSASNAVRTDSGNVAFAYLEADCSFLMAYISMMMEADSAKKDFEDPISCFERVLELKPDYHEARMSLVEIFQRLPEDMGGNKEKANQHAQILKEMDWFFGAQAGEIMLPEEASRLEYWQEVWKNNKEDIRVQKQLGQAYLADGNLEEAKPLFEKVMDADPAYNTLLLEIARHHMFQVMQGKSKPETEIPLAEASIKDYLSSEPEPIAPLKAYAIGNLAKMKFFSREEEEGERLMAEASSIDPAFSKAFAVPDLSLYIPPGEIYRRGEYSSFLRPF